MKHAAAHRPHGKSCADTLTTSTTDYSELFGSAGCAVSRMKGHWFYLIHKFEGAEKLEKQLRKVREPWEYEVVVNQIFTLPFRP